MFTGRYFRYLVSNQEFFYINNRGKRVYPDLRPYLQNMSDFLTYLNRCQKSVMTCNYYEGLEKKNVVIPYHNRYSPNYIRSIYARLKKLERWAVDNFDGKLTLLTLTVSQKGKTISECLDCLQEAKKKLFHILRNIRGELGYLEYIWIIEPHKSGFPHCHVILFTHCDFKQRYEHRLKSLWAKSYQAGDYEHGLQLGSDESGYENSDSKSIEYLTQYIFKYMQKTLLMDLNPAYCVFHAEVWKKYKPVKNMRRVETLPDGSHKVRSLGRGAYRLWDSSRGLKEIMKYEKKDEEGKNVISMSLSRHNGEGEDSILYESQNIDLLESIFLRHVVY